VQRYRAPLLRYCSRLLSPTRAEDAVQQAFLSAHRAIHAGDADLNLRPWLYRIAHNASLNLLRQHGYDHDQVSDEIDGVETPPQAFERGERLRTVVAAVQELPERQRNAIVLQAVEGRSYDEIASELGVTDGAVRQLLNRARNTLREAAAALTPTGLLARIGSAAEAPVAERVAAVVAGTGGGALLAKAGATLIVAGAVAGGAVSGTLPGTGGGDRGEGRAGHGQVEAAAASDARGDGAGGVELVDRRGGPSSRRGRGDQRHGSSSRSDDGARTRGGDQRGSGSDDGSRSGDGFRSDDHSGAGERSGSSDGDHSGSGDRSGSSDGGHSGSGSGDRSGSGSGSGDSGSGSGDDGSGSGDGGSGSSGSGSSGSSGSGSGSGDDGGSFDSGSSTSDSSGSGSTSGTSGSDSSGSGSSGSGSGSDDSLDSLDPLDDHSGSSH
jgi:RNA polymerase sigma factor (sigma-70 family)